MLLKILFLIAVGLISSCSNESTFTPTGSKQAQTDDDEDSSVEEAPTIKEVDLDYRSEIPSVDEYERNKKIFDVDGKILEIPTVSEVAAEFDSQLPTRIEPTSLPAGPSLTYEAPKISGNIGKKFFNNSFDIQLSGVKGEQLRYLSIKSEAAGTLNCTNGTPVEAGTNITIPIGSFPGEIMYFYVVSCDVYGNISPETAFAFTYDNVPPRPPVASELAKVFSTPFSVSLSASSADPTATEFIKYTIADIDNLSCNEATYIEPILITSTTTLKAIVCDLAGNKSEQVSYTYTKDTTPPSAPGIAGDTGNDYYNQSFNVQLTGGAGETLRYLIQTSAAAGTLT